MLYFISTQDYFVIKQCYSHYLDGTDDTRQLVEQHVLILKRQRKSLIPGGLKHDADLNKEIPVTVSEQVYGSQPALYSRYASKLNKICKFTTPRTRPHDSVTSDCPYIQMNISPTIPLSSLATR